jgi:hypothetical protein
MINTNVIACLKRKILPLPATKINVVFWYNKVLGSQPHIFIILIYCEFAFNLVWKEHSR